ncbi:MAG: lysophospholipid acyltransferase family protein [Nitrospirae bacterium]|nr:lysophospholipid acyltransferase family protein [Nitrospirota bacterium]
MAKKKKSKFAINSEYIIVLFLMKVLSILPYRVVSDIGGMIGILGYYLDSRHRNITLKNLGMAFPDLEHKRIINLAKKAYKNLGRSAAEAVYIATKNPAYVYKFLNKRITIEGKENLKSEIKKGNGVIYLTGHFGNWELMGITFGTINCPYNVIVRPLDNPRINSILLKLRGITGGKVLPKKNVLRDVLRCLKNGEALAILIDQNTSRDLGVFVDYFGTPAATNKGPAIIAMKSGASVIPTFLVREGKYRHRLIFGETVNLCRSGDKEKDIYTNTEIFTNILESFVRKYPDQWFWMHQRWKTRPEERVRA